MREQIEGMKSTPHALITNLYRWCFALCICHLERWALDPHIATLILCLIPAFIDVSHPYMYRDILSHVYMHLRVLVILCTIAAFFDVYRWYCVPSLHVLRIYDVTSLHASWYGVPGWHHGRAICQRPGSSEGDCVRIFARDMCKSFSVFLNLCGPFFVTAVILGRRMTVANTCANVSFIL